MYRVRKAFTMRVDLSATSIIISLGILPLMASKNACTKEKKEIEKGAYKLCGESKLKDYRVIMRAGPDGKPDWVSRKFCNFMTAILLVIFTNNVSTIVSYFNVKDCTEGCMPCHTKSEIYAVQLEELGNSLERFSATFKSWDSNKCPMAKKMVQSTNSSKVAMLVDSLDNNDDYQYDYDTLHFGVRNTESQGNCEESLAFLIGIGIILLFT